jgi:hypothetical protein
MAQIVRLLWLLVVAGGGALCWWYMYGPWQNAGDSLLAHDMVRFGPLPLGLTIAWTLLLIVTLFASAVSGSLTRNKRNSDRGGARSSTHPTTPKE